MTPILAYCSTSSYCQLYLEDLQDDHETSSEWKLEEHISPNCQLKLEFLVGTLASGIPFGNVALWERWQFLQTANSNWNSLWERWLPDLVWRLALGGLCHNEAFEKALAEILHEKSAWIEMLAQRELWQNNLKQGHLDQNSTRILVD